MGHDLIRDSTIGQVINYVSNGRIFPYADQRPSYVVPTCLLAASASPEKTKSDKNRSAERLDVTGTTPSPTDLERQSTGLTLGCDISDPYLIDWEENDPDNPQNWSLNKRAFVAFEISFLTFSVYIGSAIYVSSIPGLMQEFRVSLTTATLGLTLYILAYGIGAMFLTPLQELHLLGRNPVYMATLFLFVIFQIPTITAKNINTILAMRFMTGLSGSPALATGGASMADIFPSSQQPYVIGIWAFGGIAGPIIGPIIGGFAAQAESWRWPILELLWISGFSLAFLGLLLPETHGPTILLRRAKRLRALTGNHELRTATNEIDGGKLVYDALVLPLVLSIEPVLLFANIYLGFIYAVFYLWFEAFPLVFGDIYHFNEGLSGLPLLGFLVSGVFTYTVYCLYQMYHIAPRYARAAAANKEVPPEIKLEIGLMASIFIPTSVLIFGFASKPSIHWIVPVIGAALYLPGLYLIFQSILMYITTAYPDHGAPVLAGNTLFRAAIASVFPLFGRAFFRNLGLGPGSAVLAGISFFLMAVYWVGAPLFSRISWVLCNRLDSSFASMAPPSKKFYLFGYPIAHSSAPALHNNSFKSLGTESTYSIWSTSKVTEEMLAVIHDDDCGGAAVTMPIKTAIIPFLDELSPESRVTNACDTIVKVPTPGGGFKLVGQNTDILGVRNALLSALKAQHFSRPTPIPSDAAAAYPLQPASSGLFAGLVIGGGATTRSAAHALTLLGLVPIFLINRDVDEVHAVMDAMPHLSSKGGLIHLRDPADVETHLVGEGKARILMAVGCIPSFAPQTLAERMVYTTTSAVLTVPYIVPTAESPVLPYPTQRLFLEMPYKPLQTTMYKVAAAHGWHVIDGIEAMIEQGFAQQRMWLRGVASVAVGSDSSITGPALEEAARKNTRERLTAPTQAQAIKTEVDRAEGKVSAVPPSRL